MVKGLADEGGRVRKKIRGHKKCGPVKGKKVKARVRSEW